MTTTQALKWVKDNWDKLPKDTLGYGSNKTKEAVWFIDEDTDEEWGINQEAIGMTKDGKLLWAYASGCSCWEGEYEIHEVHSKDIKTLEFNHTDLKDKWEIILLEFVEQHI